MFLLVGLGNPGKKYENTRHNIGFKAVDEIIRRFSFTSVGNKYKSLCYSGDIGGHKVIAIEPQTFMNRSGIAVQEAANFYKIPLENIIVAHDELDLLPGKVRVKQGGGAGGHNGLKSIDAHLGKEYVRVRIGIGHPGSKDEVTGYVLSAFEQTQDIQMQRLVEEISLQLPLLLECNTSLFMSKIAQYTETEKNL
jgi:PTH1 family peptidyl-tRNA hydrolase